MSEIKFTVFADHHYKKRMYASTVDDLKAILRKAENENCELVIHEGDFSNDYKGSREITDAFIGSNLPVFGVYGNHELETPGNTMAYVTPLLTNCAKDATWGTQDGKIGDGSIAYYYYDVRDFRFIFLDTNYSIMPNGKTYEHNRENSWGMPRGNTRENTLGNEQLKWLEDVLTDAAKKDLHCIINSHASFTERRGCSPDAKAVRELFTMANGIKPSTVLMCINGHYHTDLSTVIDGIYYFDVNTTINGWWQGEKYNPYRENDPENPKYTFNYVDYDENGHATNSEKLPLSSLSMGEQTQFFSSPLSAVVTVNSDGKIKIIGAKTDWIYGINKADLTQGARPEISDYQNY